MKSTVLFAVLVCFYLNSVTGNSCGGLLEGEQGRFRLDNASDQEHPKTSSSSCIWILQSHFENNIRFTLDALSDDAHLNVYPEDQLTSCSLNDYTKLNSTHVGSSFEFLGKTLIVVLPSSSASVAFSWHFMANEDKKSNVTIMKNSDYVDSPNGLLEWGQLETEERVTWAINTNANLNIKWDADVATSCNAIDSCACFYFALFQLTSEGVLSEALKTCGQSSEGKLDGIRGRAVVLVKVKTKFEANKVAVSWELDDTIVTGPPVTELPITEPPTTEPPATGLFAATETGLVALNLQTFDVTALTSELTEAVAVNNKLQKVYWSQNGRNASILRSNFDGSVVELIVPPTGGHIYALAVDEVSGNVYFSSRTAQEAITFCNSLGKNCSQIISNSSLIHYANDIALDSKNGVMYWSNSLFTEASLIQANLDGSGARIILTGFAQLYGITLEQPSNEVLYWTDYQEIAIGTIQVDGSNKHHLLKLQDGRPFGIQVDAHKVYFGNYDSMTIQSFDKDSGKELTTIFKSTGGVRHLALFNVQV